MTLILDTDDEIFIAADADDMVQQLITQLDSRPHDEALAKLAAAVLGCDVLDVVITRTDDS